MRDKKKPVTFKTLIVGIVFVGLGCVGFYFFVYHFMLSAFRRFIPMP